MAANAFVTAIFEYSKELDLHLEWHVAQFVQKERTPIGLLDLAASAFAFGPRERTGFIPKEFAFDEIRWQRGGIDHHEGLLAAGTQLVNGLRNEFLSGSTLADQ